MELTIYQVDAFAQQVFEGNPAAVIPLTEWLPDATLQAIAAENNLSETAYFVDQGDHYHLRWFTPAREVRLCGHATLASAHVLFHHLNYPGEEIVFKTLGGILKVQRIGDQLRMDFPADVPKPVDAPVAAIEAALGTEIQEVVAGLDDYLVRILSVEQLEALTPDFKAVAELDPRGIIVTTSGNQTDIASRCFFPSYGIDEDPVTGSAHTLLTPYWTARLEQPEISAVQGGARKGYLNCRLEDDRVLLMGKGVTYLIGTVFLP